MSSDSTGGFVLTLCARDSLDSAIARLGDLTLAIEDRQPVSETVCRLTCQGKLEDGMQWLAASRDKLGAVDAWVTSLSAPRYQLMICDMDMTMVAAETLDEVAASLGLGDEIAAITNRAMLGEIEFDQALRQRIAMLADYDESVFTDLLPKMELSPGADALLAAAAGQGTHTILVSGGFSQIAESVGARLGFNEVYCNQLAMADGKLTGEVRDPIVNAQYKLDLLQRRAAELGIDLSECCAIGDGANDIPMLAAAGLGIAYYGKPVLRAATACQINHTDLNSAIYFMGLE